MLALSLFSGCSSKEEAGTADAATSYIGIISAMQNEIDLLMEEADIAADNSSRIIMKMMKDE